MTVFEETVLSRIFGPESDEVTRSWKEMEAEGFIIGNVLQILLLLSKQGVRVGGTCSTHAGRISAFKMLVGWC